MKYINLVALVFLATFANANDKPEYAFDKVDKKLLPNANAIVRLSEQEVTILDLDNVLIRSHYVVTILKKEGETQALYSEYFSKLGSVEDIYGFIYDKRGELQFKIKEKDFRTFGVSAQAGYYDNSH